MRELEEITIPYLKSPNDLEKVRTSLAQPTVKNLVLESRVRRVVYTIVM